MNAANSLDSWHVSLTKSFIYRAQAVFYGRLSLCGLYAGLWLLAFATDSNTFPHSPRDLALIAVAVAYAVLCYQHKSHESLGRWLHFTTLTADIVLHLWFTREGEFLLSPLMPIHPFLSAAFLLLFHNPLLMLVPLSILPVATALYFNAHHTITVAPLMSSLLMYGGLDMLAIFFIHLAHSKEHQLLRSMVALEKKLKELALVKERQRIAREFHDGVGAQLASIVMQCDYVGLKNGPPPGEIGEIKNAALEAIDDMRRSVAFLQGEFDISEQMGLFFDNFERRHGLVVKQEGIEHLRILLPEQQIACCRIVEEALMNALKHAQASLLSIIVTKQPSSLTIIIKDNGRGFDASLSKKHHYGIKNMLYRAHHMGAQLVLDTSPHAGTTISLDIPAH